MNKKKLKILHLLSNFKYTGPAELALDLVWALKQRGHEVTFAIGKAPEPGTYGLKEKGEERGIEPTTDFILNKHRNIFDNLRGFPIFVDFLKKENFEIIHTHQTNDHNLAGKAARKAFPRLPIVRTFYGNEILKPSFTDKKLFTKLVDGLIVLSKKAYSDFTDKFLFPTERIWKLEGFVDCTRYNPDTVQEIRSSFGIDKSEIVLGIVARMQRHRRYEVLWEAVKIAVEEIPDLKIVVIGRGTHRKKVGFDPVKKMGLTNNVIFTGYRRDDYIQTLASIDVKIFLVPGSDGSCRAVRQAMAMGKPVIATKRGMLPEIIEDGHTGLLIEDTPENLAQAMIKMIRNSELRNKLGKAALEKARTDYSLDRHAQKVEEIYISLKSL